MQFDVLHASHMHSVIVCEHQHQLNKVLHECPLICSVLLHLHSSNARKKNLPKWQQTNLESEQKLVCRSVSTELGASVVIRFNVRRFCVSAFYLCFILVSSSLEFCDILYNGIQYSDRIRNWFFLMLPRVQVQMDSIVFYCTT